MAKKDVYIYAGDGGVIQSTIKIPYARYDSLVRLIADDGKELVNGDVHTICIDVAPSDVDKWQEVDKAPEA